MNISNIPVVFFSDFEHAHLNENGFTKVSYGDAVYTLVQADALVNELIDRLDAELMPLITELQSIPPSFLIALDG